MIRFRHILWVLLSFGTAISLGGCKLAILDPKGIIAADERNLLITAVLLMLTIVVPVIVLTLVFAWRYRESNTEAKYSPEWSHSTALEVICWSIPSIIIIVLGTITWISSHQLDPYRPLETSTKPITIQAIALNWKWLFIYPDQNVASVNYLQIPVNVPVRFLITADAPMNSFAIPQLAGQIYAMTGMQTKLNIMANEIGEYQGLSTNYSGEGFSDMNFVVRASTEKDFQQWISTVQRSPSQLTMAAYNKLIEPSENNPREYFSLAQKDIFNVAMMKYMMPMKNMGEMAVASSQKNKEMAE